MGNYLESTNVRMYPSSRRTDDLNAMLNSEQNITSISNRITSHESYIIGYSESGGTYNFELCIHGYYFDITGITPPNTGDKVYATIKLVSTEIDGTDFIELAPYEGNGVGNLDINGEFKGLYISSDGSSSSNDDYYSLLILKKDSNVWNVPSTSMLRINSKFIGITDSENNKRPLNIYIADEHKKLQDNIDTKASLDYVKTLNTDNAEDTEYLYVDDGIL